MPQTPLYPLTFEPIYKEKVWGGRTLEKLGRRLPDGPDTAIGESWDVVDLAQTEVFGGGGGSERSVVANGPLAGRTLHDLLAEFGKALLGDLAPNEFGEFPLLVKFLDARENLSVQVHPSAAYAAAHDDAFLKSEAWYIIHAEPGAVIYKGVRAGTSPQQFRDAIESNEVEPLMLKLEVRAGDCHYLPSGTCHALGAGVLVAEVQTPSDTTFRVYDWGRTGRKLHIDEALQCIEFGPPDVSRYEQHTRYAGAYADMSHLVSSEHFRIDKVRTGAAEAHELAIHQPTIWMVLGGCCCITSPAGPDVAVRRGQTLLLPPVAAGMRLTVDDELEWLEVTFPQAEVTRIA